VSISVCVSEREREKSPAKNEHTKEIKHPRSVQKGGKEVGQEHQNQHQEEGARREEQDQPPNVVQEKEHKNVQKPTMWSTTKKRTTTIDGIVRIVSKSTVQ